MDTADANGEDGKTAAVDASEFAAPAMDTVIDDACEDAAATDDTAADAEGADAEDATVDDASNVSTEDVAAPDVVSEVDADADETANFLPKAEFFGRSHSLKT